MRVLKSKHELYLQLGRRKGLALTLRNRDYAGHPTLIVKLTWFGSFLWFNPHRSRRCWSNGVILFSLYRPYGGR